MKALVVALRDLVRARPAGTGGRHVAAIAAVKLPAGLAPERADAEAQARGQCPPGLMCFGRPGCSDLACPGHPRNGHD